MTSPDIAVGIIGTSTVIAAGIATGRKLVTQDDAFVENQTRCDRQSYIPHPCGIVFRGFLGACLRRTDTT